MANSDNVARAAKGNDGIGNRLEVPKAKDRRPVGLFLTSIWFGAASYGCSSSAMRKG
jgi:hypothetical protein